MSLMLLTTPAKTQLVASDSIARRAWARLGGVYLLFGAFAWMLSSEVRHDNWAVHGVWCVAGLAVAMPTIVRALSGNFSLVLTDHRLMFLASFSLYFLFGASLLWIGPQNQIDQSLGFYPIDARDALRADAINGLGLGLALLSTAISSARWIEALAAGVAAKTAWISADRAIALFLILGTTASIFLFVREIGDREGFSAGIVGSAGKLATVAVLLAASHHGRGEFILRTFAVILAFVLSFGGVLQFNKLEALLPLASLAGGLGLRFGSRKIMPIALVVILAVYYVLGNITSYGRNLVFDRIVGIDERWQIVMQSWKDTRQLSEEEEYGAWARLSYVAVQVAALDFQDKGQGGDGFSLIGWVFVPRLLAPDKPEITKTGREFNVKINGMDTSASGQGIFASGYYHGGWAGLLFASLVCGWILAQTSGVARAVSAKRALVMLPFSLLGVFMAFRIDGDFISDYVGSFVFILYPIVFGSLVLAAGRGVKRPSDGPDKRSRGR